MYPRHGTSVHPGAEGVDVGSHVGGRSPRAPVRRRAQGGSRLKPVVRWSGATSRQRKRFKRETQARRGRATRAPTSQNVGSARGATAPRTQRTRDSPNGGGGKAVRGERKRSGARGSPQGRKAHKGAQRNPPRHLGRPQTGGAYAERPTLWAPRRKHGTAGLRAPDPTPEGPGDADSEQLRQPT